MTRRTLQSSKLFSQFGFNGASIRRYYLLKGSELYCFTSKNVFQSLSYLFSQDSLSIIITSQEAQLEISESNRPIYVEE
jgi:hypothetical protein